MADVTFLMERASDEANRARGLQHTRFQMLQGLEQRAIRPLSSIYDKSISSSLVSDDAGYLGFLKVGLRRYANSSKRRAAIFSCVRPCVSSATSFALTLNLTSRS